MEDEMKLRKMIFFSSTILVSIIFFLASCASPTAVPTDISPEAIFTSLPITCDPVLISAQLGITMLRLQDGSEIHLSDNTEIELTVAGYCPGITSNQIDLLRGQVAVKILPEGSLIQVTAPGDVLATIDTTGLASYDPESGAFILSCTNGTCTVSVAGEEIARLGCGEGGVLEQDGTYKGPYTIDLALLAPYGEWLVPTCVLPVSSTPDIVATETPDKAATATSYCATFESQFPLTPCAPYVP